MNNAKVINIPIKASLVILLSESKESLISYNDLSQILSQLSDIRNYRLHLVGSLNSILYYKRRGMIVDIISIRVILLSESKENLVIMT